MRRLEPFSPVARGLRRQDDRRVISGIIYFIRPVCGRTMRLPLARYSRASSAS
jgi:hypothetical protein